MVELIAITKNGDYLEVHPTCLAQHKALGWKECEKQKSTSDEPAVDTKKRGRPAKD